MSLIDLIDKIQREQDFELRGKLASSLSFWHRLTGKETAELVAFLAAVPHALRYADQTVRAGDVLRLVKMSPHYHPETLFLCVDVNDGHIKARSHFGTPDMGPTLIWLAADKWFEVIGHVAVPAERSPT